ncbi:homocysteine S-methyltransferase [Streptomyces sp. MUM 178J]|uniref:homocysteine S-methyltransferase n=1 Tax=Streptomyces sp. MUM 178J TaxID=2791991 RepID=UPI001F032E3C|nr:homocysteine S-methyltransferase [Streptomyces sp. MUM 178J]WRQ80649.1 homocysteine S-methyltransferase [Streptomyces sp. MUM 178J]
MKPSRALADVLAERVVLLDGGLSNQLQAQGCDLSDDLWSARLLADGPGQIEAAHTAYARAGAEVLITASYQATFEGFARRGVTRRETEALLTRSVTLARRAAETVPHEVWVAASVGPYGAMLADGSEYRGRYGLSVAELTRFHRPRVETLAAAGPDVLALETVPDADEAEALLRAAEGCGIPLWLTYTATAAHTRAGQSLADAFALPAAIPAVIAAGVNCVAPADAASAVSIAATVTGRPGVAYPNSGEHWTPAHGWQGEKTFTPARLADWTAAGARLIGGCCRVGPRDIADLARLLKDA